MFFRTLAAILALASQTPAPDDAEFQKLVARVRQAALTYSDRLQNFTCTQTTTRSLGPSPDGTKRKPLETQEFELNYVDHREHYKLVKVNGEATNPEKLVKAGHFKGYGQFGSALQNIFHPAVEATFEWDHRETGAGGETCVFRYRVAQPNSRAVMTADYDIVKLGHHGMIWANCDSGEVLRFQTVTDLGEVHRSGRRVPIGYRLEVRYGVTNIGERQFLLPQTAVDAGLFFKTWTREEMQFTNYRKFDASSTILY